MISRKTKSYEGFTLVELLAVMSIISLIAMTFFYGLSSSIKSSTKNEIDIKALNLAQTEIENIRSEIKLGNITEDKLINKDIDIDSRIYKVSTKVNKEDSSYMYSIEVSVMVDIPFNFNNKTIELNTEVFGK